MRLYVIIIKNNDLSVSEIIYSDGPLSEFKNEICVKIAACSFRKITQKFSDEIF